MNVYFVELIRKEDGRTVLYSAEEAIIFRAKDQAEDFIAEQGYSDKYDRKIVCREVSDPFVFEEANRTLFPYAVQSMKTAIEGALLDNHLKGIFAKDVLERAVAKWIAYYAESYFHTPDEMTDVIFGICKEIQTEAMEEWSRLDVEVQSMGDALMGG